jgi:hypothetical protein
VRYRGPSSGHLGHLGSFMLLLVVVLAILGRHLGPSWNHVKAVLRPVGVKLRSTWVVRSDI